MIPIGKMTICWNDFNRSGWFRSEWFRSVGIIPIEIILISGMISIGMISSRCIMIITTDRNHSDQLKSCHHSDWSKSLRSKSFRPIETIHPGGQSPTLCWTTSNPLQVYHPIAGSTLYPRGSTTGSPGVNYSPLEGQFPLPGLKHVSGLIGFQHWTNADSTMTTLFFL